MKKALIAYFSAGGSKLHCYYGAAVLIRAIETALSHNQVMHLAAMAVLLYKPLHQALYEHIQKTVENRLHHSNVIHSLRFFICRAYGRHTDDIRMLISQ